MREEQGLSAENMALVGRLNHARQITPNTAAFLIAAWPQTNILLDAARSEGRAKPQGDVGADSGLAAADDNHKALVEGPEYTRDPHGHDCDMCVRSDGLTDRERGFKI